MERTEPDIRPLGLLALGAAILSVALAMTYFYSPVALLVAVIALPLGLMSLGHERSRGLGIVAIVMAVIAIVAATAMLIWTW